MERITIKFIFKGKSEALRKPEIINNTLCVYFNRGDLYQLTINNKTFFELLANTNNKNKKQEIITLLQTPKFYEFIGLIPNFQNYVKLLAQYTLDNPKFLKEIISHYKEWEVSKKSIKKEILYNFSKITKKIILKDYFDALEIKYPKSKNQITKAQNKEKPKVRKRMAIRRH